MVDHVYHGQKAINYYDNPNVIMWMVKQEVVSIDFYNKPNIVMLMVK
jgi:hypothetical protein